jgi:hypothetical protein
MAGAGASSVGTVRGRYPQRRTVGAVLPGPRVMGGATRNAAAYIPCGASPSPFFGAQTERAGGRNDTVPLRLFSSVDHVPWVDLHSDGAETYGRDALSCEGEATGRCGRRAAGKGLPAQVARHSAAGRPGGWLSTCHGAGTDFGAGGVPLD